MSTRHQLSVGASLTTLRAKQGKPSTSFLWRLNTLLCFHTSGEQAPTMFETIEDMRDGIAEALEKKKHFTVFDNDLSKFWPPARHTRQKQIEAIQRFAKEHGWEVTIRDQGLIATFRKVSPEPADGSLNPRKG